MLEKGLGRIYIPDKRDLNYPLSAKLPKTVAVISRRMWRSSTYWGDQGKTSQCVAYSWIHFIHHSPLTYPGKNPIIPPLEMYNEAQQNDEWPGENYEGTSVRAGADVLLKRGLIKEYRWGKNIEELISAVLQIGPVVLGTVWLTGMFNPDASGFIKFTGWPAGGHAYLVDGVDIKLKYFRIKQSWGRNWGVKGNAFISFVDMEALLTSDYSEICLAIETRKS